MTKPYFKILKKDVKTNARLGVLSTPHGNIKTPSYVIVATHAQIKCLRPGDIKKTKTQVVIANTFHLWSPALLSKASGKTFLTKRLGLNIPTITDSGGFQVFSLGFGQKKRIGKILTTFKVVNPKIIHRRKNIKITNHGVWFPMNDGKKKFLGPALSIKLQEKLGGDIMFAFDECTSPLDNFKYNKKAIERTHRWAKGSLMAKTHKNKLLFGIIQGGRFKNLRIKSAKFVGSLPFDGFGIGGSFGKNEMIKTLKWVVPHLPEEKPRHLLGIGRVKDIFNAVESGMDLFDCVIPTREARHGRIYTKHGHYDISKNHNENIFIENGCRCPVCKSKMTRAKLRELFKKNLPKAQRLATIHNVWFFNNLLEQVRRAIAKNKYLEFKNNFFNS